METPLNPHLTVAQASPVAEQEMRGRLGNDAFEHLYRSLLLQTSEHTADEEDRLMAILALVGKTRDTVMMVLCIIALAKMEACDPRVEQMLALVREWTLQRLILDARKAVREAGQA